MLPVEKYYRILDRYNNEYIIKGLVDNRTAIGLINGDVVIIYSSLLYHEPNSDEYKVLPRMVDSWVMNCFERLLNEEDI